MKKLVKKIKNKTQVNLYGVENDIVKKNTTMFC